MNSLYQQMNQQQLGTNIGAIKQMMNSVRYASNPQAMLQQMPQYNQIMQIIQDNGGDAQKAFYAMADKMGIDGNEIINILK